MSAIETLLQQPAAQAVGWALLQFVWQGALVGALTRSRCLRCAAAPPTSATSSPTIGLALMLTLPVVTGVQKWQSMPTPRRARRLGRGDPTCPGTRSASASPA